MKKKSTAKVIETSPSQTDLNARLANLENAWGRLSNSLLEVRGPHEVAEDSRMLAQIRKVINEAEYLHGQYINKAGPTAGALAAAMAELKKQRAMLSQLQSSLTSNASITEDEHLEKALNADEGTLIEMSPLSNDEFEVVGSGGMSAAGPYNTQTETFLKQFDSYQKALYAYISDLTAARDRLRNRSDLADSNRAKEMDSLISEYRNQSRYLTHEMSLLLEKIGSSLQAEKATRLGVAKLLPMISANKRSISAIKAQQEQAQQNARRTAEISREAVALLHETQKAQIEAHLNHSRHHERIRHNKRKSMSQGPHQFIPELFAKHSESEASSCPAWVECPCCGCRMEMPCSKGENATVVHSHLTPYLDHDEEFQNVRGWKGLWAGPLSEDRDLRTWIFKRPNDGSNELGNLGQVNVFGKGFTQF